MLECTYCSTPIPDHSRFCHHCGTPVPGVGERPTSPQSQEVLKRLRQATEGRYEILRELGRGGMGLVFLGYQKSLDRQVAIKVLLPVLAFDLGVVQRFQREARTQAKLEHPNIISVYEVYDEGGLTFFTMPYVAGGSLRLYLDRHPRPPLRTVVRFLRQAADGLYYAHRRGVIHRDVKPENMLIDPDRNALILTDFGIAKALAAQTTLTTPGDLLGTPRYMSPEQGEGQATLDGRADQYSLGLLGWEMLAGRAAFEATSLAELMYKHRFEHPGDIDEIRPDAPPGLREAIKRAIRKDREERFRSMGEFLPTLESVERELPAEPTADPEATASTLRVETPPAGMRETPPSEDAAPVDAPDEPPDERSAGGAAPDELTAEVTARPIEPDSVALGPTAVTPTPSHPAGDSRRESGPPSAPARAATGPRRIALAAGGALALLAVALLLFRSSADRARSPESENMVASSQVQEELETSPGPAGDAATDATDGTIDAPVSETDATGGTVRKSPEAGRPGEASSAPGTEPQREPARVEPGREASSPETPTRRDAERARTAARRARTAAEDAGANLAFPDAFAALVARQQTAERQFTTGRLRSASTGFGAVRLGFRELTSRAARAREEATAARAAAERSRERALDAGAAATAAERLTAIDRDLERAAGLLARGDHPGARDLFSASSAAYGELAEDLASADAQQGEEQPITLPPDESAPEAEAPPAPESELRALLETYRQAFQSEDMARLRSQVYAGEIPRRDAELLRAIFDGADGLQIQLEERELRVDGNSASADIRLGMRFRQARTGTAQRVDLELRMKFAHTPDGWRLLEARR